MSDIPRVCATCVHFVFHESEQGYSELTPGTDCSFSCSKGYWHAVGSDCTEDAFRSSMLAATYCLDYEMVHVEPPAFHPTFPLNVDGLVGSLNEKYPDFIVGITNFPHHAWYERLGVGMTTSGSFVAPGQAYLWLEQRLREMAEEEAARAVETDRIDVLG